MKIVVWYMYSAVRVSMKWGSVRVVMMHACTHGK